MANLFSSPLDKWTWLVLVAFSIINIFLTWNPNLGKFSGISVTTILSTFSVLFASLIGLSSQNPRMDRSMIFTSWSAFCIILMTFYTGMMTSTMILLPEVNALRNVTDLVDQKYTLVYPNKLWKVATEVLAKDINYSDLTLLIEEAAVRENYINDLAFGDRNSIVIFWTVAFNAISLANKLIASTSVKSEERRLCSVGTELLSSGKAYIVFLPPNSEKLARVVQRLVDTGIYQVWGKEYVGFSLFRRVQDRVKFISKTKVRFDENRDDKPLTLSGKKSNVFILFRIFLGLDLFVFVCELLLFHVTVSKDMRLKNNMTYYIK